MSDQIRVTCECGGRLSVKREEYALVDGAACAQITVGPCHACIARAKKIAEDVALAHYNKQMASC